MRFIRLNLLVVVLLSISSFGQFIDINTQTKGSRLPSFGTDSGSANAYAIATIAAIGSGGVLQNGSLFYFKATHANTTASTLAVNGGSAIAIKKNVSSALTGGEIPLNAIVFVAYDGTNFQLQGVYGASVLCSQMPALTGDVTSSAGSCATTLADTAVTPGSYTSTDLTVDSKGRITAASNGTGGGTGTAVVNIPVANCVPGQTRNVGNSYWTINSLTNIDDPQFGFVKAVAAELDCSYLIPHNLSGTTGSVILYPRSADVTNAHTAAIKLCDAITSSLNPQVGALTCTATQNYSSTTTAWSTTALTFTINATLAADQELKFTIVQSASGSNTSDVLFSPPIIQLTETF